MSRLSCIALKWKRQLAPRDQIAKNNLTELMQGINLMLGIKLPTPTF